jgi:hypothetical protein
LTAGLTYHYFSAGIKIKSPVAYNPYTSALGSVNFSGSASGTQIELEFNNSYHFINLPLLLQVQAFRFKNWNLTFEGGGVFSRFITGTALLFDKSSGQYYEDHSSLRPSQWSVSAGLLAGFRLGHTSWQIGPQWQYALSPLMKIQATPNGHLVYGGIKLVYIPINK